MYLIRAHIIMTIHRLYRDVYEGQVVKLSVPDLEPYTTNINKSELLKNIMWLERNIASPSPDLILGIKRSVLVYWSDDYNKYVFSSRLNTIFYRIDNDGTLFVTANPDTVGKEFSVRVEERRRSGNDLFHITYRLVVYTVSNAACDNYINVFSGVPFLLTCTVAFQIYPYDTVDIQYNIEHTMKHNWYKKDMDGVNFFNSNNVFRNITRKQTCGSYISQLSLNYTPRLEEDRALFTCMLLRYIASFLFHDINRLGVAGAQLLESNIDVLIMSERNSFYCTTELRVYFGPIVRLDYEKFQDTITVKEDERVRVGCPFICRPQCLYKFFRNGKLWNRSHASVHTEEFPQSRENYRIECIAQHPYFAIRWVSKTFEIIISPSSDVAIGSPKLHRRSYGSGVPTIESVDSISGIHAEIPQMKESSQHANDSNEEFKKMRDINKVFAVNVLKHKTQVIGLNHKLTCPLYRKANDEIITTLSLFVPQHEQEQRIDNTIDEADFTNNIENSKSDRSSRVPSNASKETHFVSVQESSYRLALKEKHRKPHETFLQSRVDQLPTKVSRIQRTGIKDVISNQTSETTISSVSSTVASMVSIVPEESEFIIHPQKLDISKHGKDSFASFLIAQTNSRLRRGRSNYHIRT
ncbi:unnamed protein product [Didymodactylos carnosus]|uniref:Uncharacterized protein n=1 Tax=Didymodactylos carnosus TaxID=1234261 RepID=A0A815D9J9_9BILA|nr:unnamed protein product [Didymodactylos carnosus]CAF4107588.1 unnamed protein product [Didymodactylos carnosus]